VDLDYQPMTIAKLAVFVAAEEDFDTRWRLVVEFLKQCHHEPAGKRHQLLADAPGTTGDEPWDVLLAGLAEHLATRGRAKPARLVGIAGPAAVLVPFDAPGARAQALVHAPAAFRRRSVFVADYDIDASASGPSPLLDRAGIEDAFRRLGERLARRGIVADLYVFGGAAMALAYDSRRVTRDVDALFKPHGIRQLAKVLDLHSADEVAAGQFVSVKLGGPDVGASPQNREQLARTA
jgi:hypothetical protein